MIYDKLTVLQADITDVAVDAIVHPTNNAFYLGGEVGSAISRAGGQKVRNEIDKVHKTNGNLASCGGNNTLSKTPISNTQIRQF